ncbi:MAG: class II aldolase/adducin family protein [Acetobacterales bacterium]
MTERRLRRALLATARRMGALGLNTGTSGNVSVRFGDGLLITPSGRPYDRCTPGDMVELGRDGTPRGSGRPSSEWRFHRDILAARVDAGAVVHAHSPFCTALSCLERGLPAFHYMVAVAGGADIRCAGYATFGTQALSDAALAALDGRRACLLAHHGMIAIGRDLEAALALAVEVEGLAAQYMRCLQVGEPSVLAADEMTRVLGAFSGYGKPR